MKRPARLLSNSAGPLLLLPALLLGGCAEDLTVKPRPEARTEAIFDPSANPPQVPTPTDLARSRVSGLLELPVADEATRPAQAEFDRYLNTLDGFPPNAIATMQLGGELSDASAQPASLAKAITVLAIDGDDVKTIDAAELELGYRVDEAAKLSSVTIKLKDPAGWKRGGTYGFIVRGGGDDGLQDKAGKPIARSALFEVAANDSPLCEMVDDKCVYNYSALLQSTIDGQMRADPANAGKSDEQLAPEIRAAVLANATDFEFLRLAYSGEKGLLTVAEAAGIKREEIAVAWAFTVVNQTELAFDPASPTNPVIPGLGNDLLIAQQDDAAKGCTKDHVCLPPQANETPNDTALRLALNTLDGFSTTGANWAPLIGKIDPDSVTAPAAVLVLNADNPLDFSAKMTFSYNEKASAIVGVPNKPLRQNTRYAIVMTSGLTAGDPVAAGGLTDDKGMRVVASSAFALARLANPLIDGDGKSTVNVLDDATAAALEPLRLAYSEIFDALDDIGVKRESIVQAWTFKTQTITDPMVALRTLPWQALGAIDNQNPKLSGSYSTSFGQYPTSAPRDKIGAWVADGALTSINALDPTTGAFLPSNKLATDAAPWTVPLIMTIPAGTTPAGGWPLVVFQHGIGRAKTDVFGIANTLAGAGYAVIAIDAPFHGARSRCASDGDCDAGTCKQDSAIGSHCEGGSLKLAADGVPLSSGGIGAGKTFFDTDNPFAARDNIRQAVIDIAALMRAIALGGQSGLSTPVALDAANVSFVGHSMGAMLGTILLATDSVAERAVLAVPGGPWVQGIAMHSPAFAPAVDAVRKARGIEAGSAADLQLLTTFQWILDPADPANFASSVTSGGLEDKVAGGKLSAKQAIVLAAEKDTVVTAAATQFIANAMGADTTDTSYAGQDHWFLLRPDPDQLATAAAQAQMVTFLESATVCKPDLGAGTCE